MTVSRSPIYDLTASMSASFTEWQGWEVPTTFGDALAEYRAFKTGVALYDSTYVGRLKATGNDVLDLLNRLSTNLVDTIPEGKGVQTVLTDDRGRIIDLLLLLNMGPYILILVGPQNRQRVIDWVDKYTIIDDVTIDDITDNTAMFSVMGPEAASVLSFLIGSNIESLQEHSWMNAKIGENSVQILRRDGSNLLKYEIVAPREDAQQVWLELTKSGAVPMGTDAYEAIRVEAGVPGYGSELSDTYNPLEAGLWDSISFNKGCYIGQEVIARLDTYGKVQRHLVSVSFPFDAEVENGLKLAFAGKEVGFVTSIVRLPESGDLLGLAYIRKEAAALGTRVTFGDFESREAQVVGLTPASQQNTGS